MRTRIISSRLLVARLLVALLATLLWLAACQSQAPDVPDQEEEQSGPAETEGETTETGEEAESAGETVTVFGRELPPTGELRDLEGTITIAVEGVAAVPGLPPTPRQEAWQTLLDAYQQIHPGVTVEIVDLPEGQSGEQWCETHVAAHDLTDISMVSECNYFRPSLQAVQTGEVIAVDFKPHEDEINPYTGRPWKEDWSNELIRTGRCTEQGAFDMWTCQTMFVDADALLVNEDILAEYGYAPGEFPETVGELWELSRRINEDGTYVAWDDESDRWRDYIFSMYTSLGMEEYQLGGGTMEDLHAGNVPNKDDLNATEQLCNQNWWISDSPGLLEAWRQTADYVEANGGPAFYFDPARDQSGQRWLTGQAAFRFATLRSDLANIEQATQDGVFAVENWRVEGWPMLTQEDLHDQSVTIYFDGQRWLDLYGGADVFAPIPEFRASGEDPNVDLIVRDFLQFLSSPAGQEHILAEGNIPVNPVVMEEVGELANAVLALKPDVFADTNQSPGGYARYSGWVHDPERHMEAYLRGELELEEAAEMADIATTNEMIRRTEDFILTHPEVEMPAACVDWMAEQG